MVAVAIVYMELWMQAHVYAGDELHVGTLLQSFARMTCDDMLLTYVWGLPKTPLRGCAG